MRCDLRCSLAHIKATQLSTPGSSPSTHLALSLPRMNARPWQGSVRDVFVQTVRRAPSQQAQGGDSLRRIVLQRNALRAADGENDRHSSLRATRGRFLGDPFAPKTTSLERRSSSGDPSKAAHAENDMDGSSNHDRGESTDAHGREAIIKEQEEREMAWFESVMQELEIDEMVDEDDAEQTHAYTQSAESAFEGTDMVRRPDMHPFPEMIDPFAYTAPPLPSGAPAPSSTNYP